MPGRAFLKVCAAVCLLGRAVKGTAVRAGYNGQSWASTGSLAASAIGRMFSLKHEHVEMVFPDEASNKRYQGVQAKVKSLSENPQSPCWRESQLQLIEDGCQKDLPYNLKARIAIGFANCHMHNSGLEAYPCDRESEVTDCLKPFIKSAMYFQTYTEIFTHLDNLCAYARQEVFQAESLRATASLYDASVDTVSILQSLHHEEQLRFNRIFSNMDVIEGKIDQVKSIDLEILFQIFALKTMWYYVTIGLFSYFATTSIPRTERARLPLICWIAFAAVSEHYLVKKFPKDEHLVELVEKFRYFVIAASFIIIVNAVATYQNVAADTLRHVTDLRTTLEQAKTRTRLKQAYSSLARSIRVGGATERRGPGRFTKSKESY